MSVSDAARGYGTKRSRIQAWHQPDGQPPAAYVDWLKARAGELELWGDAWAGWRQNGGKLFAPEYATGYAPDDILRLHWLQEMNAALRARLRQHGLPVPPALSGLQVSGAVLQADAPGSVRAAGADRRPAQAQDGFHGEATGPGPVPQQHERPRHWDGVWHEEGDGAARLAAPQGPPRAPRNLLEQGEAAAAAGSQGWGQPPGPGKNPDAAPPAPGLSALPAEPPDHCILCLI